MNPPPVLVYHLPNAKRVDVWGQLLSYFARRAVAGNLYVRCHAEDVIRIGYAAHSLINRWGAIPTADDNRFAVEKETHALQRNGKALQVLQRFRCGLVGVPNSHGRLRVRELAE